jgi:hypothetical protein
VAQVEQHLPSKHETLNSNSITPTEKKRKEKKTATGAVAQV